MPRKQIAVRTAGLAALGTSLFLGAHLLVRADDETQQRVTTLSDCQYSANPDEFLSREARAQRGTFDTVNEFGRMAKLRAAGAGRLVQPSSVPRRNFIDEEIFARLEKDNVMSAPMATDEEFLRRVTLDLTGRTPTPKEVRDFLANASADKRAKVVDELVNSEGFVHKWTMWLGDLMQNYRDTSVQSFSNNQEGRNRMYEWIRDAVTHGRSWRDIAFEAVTTSGNNYDQRNGAANWTVKAATPMGPKEDNFDMMLVKTATVFLGMGHYDCIACHDGRNHLNALSAWGRNATRDEAQRMASHFGRIQYQRPFNNLTADNPNFYYNNSTVVIDNNNQFYDRNTTAGNRPARCGASSSLNPNGRCGSTDRLATPRYRLGASPAAGQNWREFFAQQMIEDPMFARNFANRVWKQMFNLALAEPVDNLDPLRLDPKVEPPAPWDYQASHPWLLEKLANLSRDYDYNLREILKVIANSSAYQLSSRYDGEWNITMVPLFARHYARRLEGEEVHDAIVRATNNLPRYTVGGWASPVSFALELPEPLEPRSDGTAAAFMNSFQRGNRDTSFRNQSGSVQMFLNLMNSAVVTNRTRVQQTSPKMQEFAAMRNEQAVEEMFLTFLSRFPTDAERAAALKRLSQPFTAQFTRNMAIEDLAWALINKVDFLFSY